MMQSATVTPPTAPAGGTDLVLIHRAAESRWGITLEFALFEEAVLAGSGAASDSGAGAALEDLYLARAVVSGAPAAWGRLWEEFHPFALTVARRRLRDPETAEDVVSSVFERLPELLASYGGSGSLRGWIAIMVSRRCIDQIRRNSHIPVDPVILEQRMDREAAPDESDPAVSMNRSDCARLIAELLPRAMEEINPRWRIAIDHKFRKGLTNREIAAKVFDVKEDVISKWIKKGLESLEHSLMRLCREAGERSEEDLRDCVRNGQAGFDPAADS